MKLPHGDAAIIDQRKITDYCLSPDHDDGKHKARLFQDILGLTRDHATLLLDALREAAVSGEAVPGRLDRYGQRYVIDFEFVGPTDRATLRSAWIIRPGETAPRLVTCYIL
jgi:hypothetical protein